MSERKTPGESWESLVERQIRAAQERGEFDDLEGAGRPIADIDQEYDPDWWVRKWMRREKASILPRDLELRKRIEDELETIRALRREEEVRLRLAALNAAIARGNATAPASPVPGLLAIDIDAFVVRWRGRDDPGGEVG